MRQKLPTLFEGHAPITLHEAFDAAVALFEDWEAGAPEPQVSVEGEQLPISVVFGRMRNCTDLMPSRLVVDVEGLAAHPLSPDRLDPAYADAAFVLRAMCIERLKAQTPRASTISAAAINAMRTARTGEG